MPYLTLPLNSYSHQLTFDEILDGEVDVSHLFVNNKTNTRTYYKTILPESFTDSDIAYMISHLIRFNNMVETQGISVENLIQHYNTFYVAKSNKGYHYLNQQIFNSNTKRSTDPKAMCSELRSELQPLVNQHETAIDITVSAEVFENCVRIVEKYGLSTTVENFKEYFSSAFRRIDAPDTLLMDSLRSLKRIFEEELHVLHHTSAFAYVHGRSTADALKRHQRNESKWFAKFDFSNFFGNTTIDFVIDMFSDIYPFSLIVMNPAGYAALRKALSFCFLNGGLPQGTPISPMITNTMMIPVDHILSNRLREEKERFVYTRYADDIIISSKIDFDVNKLQKYIIDVLKLHRAPFTLNESKTRYGSSSGQNWNLGLMLNRENNITVGFRNKKNLKAKIHNFVIDEKGGRSWQKNQIQQLQGLLSYYKSIENDYISHVLNKYNRKFSCNIEKLIISKIS